MAKETQPKGKDELSSFEAAALVGMSPKLLTWLASYAPKQDVDRKLKVRKEGDRLFVERTELIGFNDWLKMPWPHKPGARPPIPTGIIQEIREEASGECAMCRSNANSCEAAHIDPVSKSKNNHPENLIWLCSNHHTKFDKTGYAPAAENLEFVVGFKTTLTYFRRSVWQLQAQITGTLFSVLSACERLVEQLAAAKTPDQIAAVEGLAKQILAEIPKAVPTSKADPGFAAFTSLKPKFDALSQRSTKPKDLSATLSFASEVRTEFAVSAGYVHCPVCKGSGVFKNDDCPACNGEAEVTPGQARQIDVSRYEDVSCPLCGGEGVFKGEDCPACGGDQQLERRYAEQVDPREWEDVKCPICGGIGQVRGHDCHACGGSGNMERQQRDLIDARDYALVPCPLCNGSCSFRGEDCPECGGEGEMEKMFADQVDTRRYARVQCQICEGSGQFDDIDCRACGGDGHLDKGQADMVEKRDYDLVNCPTCRNRNSEYCRDCGGEGRMRRWVADQL